MSHLFKKDIGTIVGVPRSEYELMEGDKTIGFIQIRSQPSHGKDVPAHFGSHIYYEIDPLYQRKGYGTQILKLGLQEAKKIGLQEVIVTCFEENLASKRIIESNGGIFIDEVIVPTVHKKMLKYKIILRNT